ncbi:MAG: hypothetical protein JW863_02690 [Chitinispirillaceae bacterium]|nr:hypothetical protein [Chitinispirillaceae bacterium]
MQYRLSLLTIFLPLVVQVAATEDSTVIGTGTTEECCHRYFHEADADNVAIYFIDTTTTIKHTGPATQNALSSLSRTTTRLTLPDLIVTQDKKVVNLLGRSAVSSPPARCRQIKKVVPVQGEHLK